MCNPACTHEASPEDWYQPLRGFCREGHVHVPQTRGHAETCGELQVLKMQDKFGILLHSDSAM